MLVQAATRGNGDVGEGILPQVKTIRSVPLRSVTKTALIEVQGEGIMYLSVLEEYNKTAAEPLKNARNAAAGALRNLDPAGDGVAEAGRLFLQCRLYRGHCRSAIIGEMMEFLKRQSFQSQSVYIRFFDSIEEVEAELKRMDEMRHTLDYLIDGAVIKIDGYAHAAKLLGYTEKFPRWAVAYKFEAEKKRRPCCAMWYGKWDVPAKLRRLLTWSRLRSAV